MNTWVVVLVKDFESAKQRLGPALDPPQRKALARRTASRAIRAAGAAEHRLVVAGREGAAGLGRRAGGCGGGSTSPPGWLATSASQQTWLVSAARCESHRASCGRGPS